MGTLMIGEWGEKNGIKAYRICGHKEDIEIVIDEARKMGHRFFDTPIVNRAYGGQWTTFLQLVVNTEVCHAENT